MSVDGKLALVREGWDHFRAPRPLAAWSSWQRVLRLSPDDPAATEALKALESAEELPSAARASYRFQAPEDEAARARWNARLQAGGLDDLDLAADAFRALAEEDPTDSLALLNLALCLAWRGRNAEGIAALELAVRRSADANPERAAEAWTLAEVLRFGGGAEALADDLRYVWEADEGVPEVMTDDFFLRWPNLREVPPPVDPLTGDNPLSSARIYEWLDRPWPGCPGFEGPVRRSEIARVVATVVRAPGLLRLSSPDLTGFEALEGPPFEEVAEAFLGSTREASPLPIAWADAALGTFRPPPPADGEGPAGRSRAAVEHYYEYMWVRQPRRSLDGLSPLDASRGDATLKAKVAGVVRFREQLGARGTHAGLYQGYPFDRLRRRLGLIGPEESALLDADDVTCMSGAELDGLVPEALDEHRLADALRSAVGLGEDSRINRFGIAWLTRGPGPLAGPEAASLVAAMVREAIRESGPAAALVVLETARSLAGDRDARRAFDVWSAEVLARDDRAAESLGRYRETLELCRPELAASVAVDGAETLLDTDHPREAVALLRDALESARAAGDRFQEGRASGLLRELEGLERP